MCPPWRIIAALVLITDQLDLTGTHEIKRLCSSIVSPRNTGLIDLRPVTFILCNKSDLAAPLIVVLDVLVNIGQILIFRITVGLPLVAINRQILGCRAICCCPIAIYICDLHGAVQNGQRFQVVAGAEHNRPHFGNSCGDHHILQN